MNGGEKSAHISVGNNSKIVDVYKMKDNSAKEFIGTFQYRGRTRKVPTKSIADNAPMYRGWKVTTILRNIMVPLWQFETKHQH